MGKDKENDMIDEASDESFPASDAPSWTAAPPASVATPPRQASAPSGKNGSAARGTKHRAARIPAGVFLWTGLGLAATSLGLLLGGRKHASLYVGLLVPSILLVGVYSKAERLTGAYRPNVH